MQNCNNMKSIFQHSYSNIVITHENVGVHYNEFSFSYCCHSNLRLAMLFLATIL